MRDMTEPPTIRPTGRADLTPENLRAVLEDMGRGPGWYTSADLYNWYTGMVAEEGLEPVSKKKFGATLAELGYKRAFRRDPAQGGKHARSWFITRRALREGQ